MEQDRRLLLEQKIARLSPEKQKLLRSRLAGAVSHAYSDELTPAARDGQPFPLSQTQQGFWFMERMEPGLFNVPSVIRVNGKLDLALLRRVLQSLIERHEALRSRVVSGDGEPLVQVDAEASLAVRELDLSALPDDERELRVRQIAKEEVSAPFNLAKAPLLRLLVVHEKPDQLVLCFTFHHFVCDGWSIDLFVKEAIVVYKAYAENQGFPLAPLEWRFADYVAWQRRYLTAERLEKQLGFWREALRGAPKLLELPLDRPRPAVQTHAGGVAVVVLGREDVQRIAAFSASAGLTAFMTYIGTFGLLLARHAGQPEAVIGTPVFNRSRKEFEQLMGLFINTVVVRCDLAENPTIREYLSQRISKRVLDAFTNQDVPFHRLVRDISPDRAATHAPVFQVLFSYQSYGTDSKVHLDGLRFRALEGVDAKSTYDMIFELRARDDGALVVVAEFASELFDRATIIRLLNQYALLLRTVVESPETRVLDVPLLGAAERRLLLSDWNRTGAAFPDSSTYQNLFVECARERAASRAVFEGRVSLSYAELDRRAAALAVGLRRAGVEPNTLVALVQERGIPLLISILAVFKLGAAYVPIEPAYPSNRIAQIVTRSEAVALLASSAFESKARGLAASGGLGASTRVLYYESLTDSLAGSDVAERDAVWSGSARDLAYCIFTSGSTGVPKGAMIEHRGMINHMYAKIRDLGLGASDVVAGTASPCFDISVWQYLSVLLVGGSVAFFDEDTTHSGERFIARLVEDGVTIAEIVPSFFRVVLEELERLGDRRPSLQRLRFLMLTGEALPRPLCNRWLRLYPTIPLVNAYGPTECSDDVTHHFITEISPDSESVPVGRPIANTEIYIVDQQMSPVPIGVRGEILVGGAGVGRGYLNDPQRTAEVFLDDPFIPGPGRRIYRTRDLGRFRADGSIEFLGRIDHQVKVRGFRIELGEIETVLSKHPSVQEVAVIASEEPNGDRRLVAYLVPKGALTVAELRQFLQQKLPDYMVPSVFIQLAALPLTDNGKLDRARLPPADAAPEPESGFVAPRNAVEEVLVKIWSEALAREQLSVHDEFFSLGGHSLIAVELINRVQKAFQIQLSIRDLFGATTVAKLAEVVEGALREGAFSVIDAKSSALDGQLPPEIDPKGKRAELGAPPKRVLLTGATGFLGSYLLAELLQQTRAEVYCLVRQAEREDDAKKRIRRSLEKNSLWHDSFHSRIVPVLGDLELPRLGLSDRQFEALSAKIDAIYHNGAWINLLYPYAALKAANVSGTEEVLRLAVERKVKPVHYVSTLSVFSAAGRSSDLVFEDERLDEMVGLHGGYAQSKWFAERLLMTARERGVPVAIYRPHRITGHSQTGAWNHDDLACRIVQACVQIGSVPEHDGSVLLTPVDYVSRAIVHLSQQPASLGKAFHLVNPDSAPVTQVVDWISNVGYPLESVPRAEWQTRIFEEARKSPQSGLYPLGYLVANRAHEAVPGAERPTPKRRLRFDASNTRAGLAGSSIACPPMDRRLIDSMFTYLAKSGILGRSRPRAAPIASAGGAR